MTQKKYNEKNFRRILEKPNEMQSQRDYIEYMVNLNRNRINSKEEMLKTGSYDKFTHIYVDKTETTVLPHQHKRDLAGSPLQFACSQIQIKPRLIENGLVSNKKFQNLSEKFKRLFTEDRGDQMMKLPICGYSGHQKGEKSENMYSKNFRDITMQSTNNLRNVKMSKSFYIK